MNTVVWIGGSEAGLKPIAYQPLNSELFPLHQTQYPKRLQ
jgi:hypothetical protein